MKTTIDIQKLSRFVLLIFLMSVATSCMSTKVIANFHSADADNEQCQTIQHWKYWWGIGGSDEIVVEPGSDDTQCPCPNKAIASVEVHRSFGDFALTLLTLGIVNHVTVTYECAEVDNGEQRR